MGQGCCLVRPGPGPPFCRVEGSWGICLGSMLSPSWAEYWPYRAVQCCVRRLPGQCCPASLSSVFGLFLTTSLIISRNPPISARPPAAAQWKHHSHDTVSLCHAGRHRAALHEAWAEGWEESDGQPSEWTRVIRSAALSSLSTSTARQKKSFSASWIHPVLDLEW